MLQLSIKMHFTNILSFLQVLILEPTKVYQPSYLSINKDVDDNTVSIWHVAPDDKVGVQMQWKHFSIIYI